MSTTPNQKDLLAKKSDLEGILKPDANDILHLPDITITLAESGQFYLAGISKKLLTLIGNTSGNAVTLDGDAGLTFTTSGGSSTITGITNSSGNSTSLAASQSMVSAKQDALTAGTNINISGSTISATDTNTLSDLTDTAISSLADGQVLKYNATSGKWINSTGGSGGAEIILGTTAPTSAQGSNGDLYIQYDSNNNNVVTHEYVKISGAWEEISIGGSSVIANPSGAATDSLSSIEIDGTIYSIEGGNSWTDLTAVLEAGETSLTIIDNHITINGTYNFYTSKYGLSPLSVVIDDPSAIRLLQPLVAQESGLIVTATASTNWSGFEPWKAFANAAVNSGWIADGGSGGYWLQAEFPYKVNISSIDFKSLDSSRSHAISRVSYSNDGNTFTDATLTSSTMQNDIGHADVSMSETAKYIRLCFDYSLDIQTYPMVSQLELYGNLDSGNMTLTFEEQTEDINVKVRVS